MLSTDCLQSAETAGRQLADGGDWIHFQFRIDGYGEERVNETSQVNVLPQSCMVARYPANSLVERHTAAAARRRHVCLFLRPASVAGLLDTSASSLPDVSRWIGENGQYDPIAEVISLSDKMSLAAADMLSCSFKGSLRRSYLRGKSIELITEVVACLQGRAANAQQVRLTKAEHSKVVLAHSLLRERRIGDWTIQRLAREVGLNRSKLCSAFKSVYGVPIRQFWLELNLEHARRLLQESDISVTDLALELGYADA